METHFHIDKNCEIPVRTDTKHKKSKTEKDAYHYEKQINRLTLKFRESSLIWTELQPQLVGCVQQDPKNMK